MRHGKLAIGLGVLLTAVLILAACAGTLEPTAAPMATAAPAAESTAAPEEEPREAVAVEEPPLPWDDRYKEAEADLCPPNVECQDEIDFADPPVQELYEGQAVWVQRGLYKNAQGETFAVNVTGATSTAVTDYTRDVKVCLDQVFTGGFSEGKPSELGRDPLPEEFDANPEDLIIEIYPLAEEEPKGDYVIDFVIDPTVTDGGTHRYRQKYATAAGVIVTIDCAPGCGGSLGAELFRDAESAAAGHVSDKGGPVSIDLSRTNWWTGAWWDLKVRGEDEGTYRLIGRSEYPATWDYEPPDKPLCEPEELCPDISPGQWTTYNLSYTTEERIPNLDVLLLFDASASMFDEITAVRENARDIMAKVREEVPDAAFGVASFTDYPGVYEYEGYAVEYGVENDDYPWNLDQPITTDADAVQRSLDSLQTSWHGEDKPESYTRALSETISVSWRPGAKKVVVLFGDSVPHDTDFFMADFDRDFGVDPGRDGDAGTADDLDYDEVVQWLKEEEIEVIAINCTPLEDKYYSMTVASFNHVANETGGEAYALANAADAPETVVSSLKAAAKQYNKLALVPDHVPVGPLVWSEPWFYEGVVGGESRSFHVTITVPEGTWRSVYEFDLTIMGDGLPLKVFHVVVYVV